MSYYSTLQIQRLVQLKLWSLCIIVSKIMRARFSQANPFEKVNPARSITYPTYWPAARARVTVHARDDLLAPAPQPGRRPRTLALGRGSEPARALAHAPRRPGARAARP